MGKQRADQRGDDGGDHKDQGLYPGGVNADHRRADLGPMHGAERPAKRAVHDVLRGPDSEQQQPGHHPVPAFLASQREAQHGEILSQDKPVRPAREPDLRLQHNGDDDADPQRRHGQIMALQFQDRSGDHERQHPDRGGGDQHRAERRPAIGAGENGRPISPQAEKPGMPQRDLAGKPDEQVQAHRRDRVKAAQDQDIEIKRIRRQKGQDDQNDRQHGQPRQTGSKPTAHGSHPVRAAFAEQTVGHEKQHQQNDDEGDRVLVGR